MDWGTALEIMRASFAWCLSPRARPFGLLAWAVIIAAVVLVVACGGGGKDNVLHLRGQDVTEENYRAYVRSVKLGNLVAWGIVCNQIKDLSVEAATNFFLNSAGPTEPLNIAGAVAKPGQQPDPVAQRRATEIVKSEC